MPKRANPFATDIVQQSKIFVGLKQFNNNEHRLKNVYEKTLELLFKGAKKTPTVAIDAPVNGDANSLKKDKMKQLFIGKDGSLLQSGNMIVKKLQMSVCICGAQNESKCAYCETALCVTCQICCTRCDKTYCNRCMLIGPEEAYICLSCYS